MVRRDCELWDDENAYQRASVLARQVADRRYREPVLRQRYLDYFESLGPGMPLFDADLPSGTVT